ncbi:MAG: hypothetical protein AUJ48_00440 [Deltaproteobacteria bacterium CG1_02_45_11]|nr:MAG: hypothetical protein AUJ48_00440 [Deltaproteobacteria bacterium CG1_02_45_11]
MGLRYLSPCFIYYRSGSGSFDTRPVARIWILSKMTLGLFNSLMTDNVQKSSAKNKAHHSNINSNQRRDRQ